MQLDIHHSIFNFFKKNVRLLRTWSSKLNLKEQMMPWLITVSVIAGLTTFAAVTNGESFGFSSKTILILINIDLILLLLLSTVVAKRLVELWTARKKGLAGSRLHTKLVLFFSLFAVTPAIIVAIFSGLFFNLGMQSWFNDRVKTSLDKSLAIAEAYLQEHQKLIGKDAEVMAIEIRSALPQFLNDPTLFSEQLTRLSDLKSVPEAIIFDAKNNVVIAKAQLTFALEFEMLPQDAFIKASQGQVAVFKNDNNGRMRALLMLDKTHDLYLCIGRFVDPEVIQYVTQTHGAVSEYKLLENELDDFQLRFMLIFMVIALLLLLIAVWYGLNFSTQLTKPVRRLIIASEKIRLGDLSIQVQESNDEDELNSLVRAFNRMTKQLNTQRTDLILANVQIDERRHFTETVLSGVSAGIISVDGNDKITLINLSAQKLLNLQAKTILGKKLQKTLPEFYTIVEQVKESYQETVEQEIIITKNKFLQTLHVRIVPEKENHETKGYVITFDDITELLQAQRKAAWSDIAQRIAHEIKNPLTPIQLSAERLQKKYLKDITSDQETFINCTQTIIRQVDDIKRMVNEFSSFARMPTPIFHMESLKSLCEDVLLFQKSAYPEINFSFECLENIFVNCDRGLISQAFINLIKNAIDAIQETDEKDQKIQVTLTHENRDAIIIVEDNGKGLPKDRLDQLTEPYITTKEKGTGLGLAIVKKIMQDHQGDVLLQNRKSRGACVTLRFKEQYMDHSSKLSGTL